MRRLTKMFHFTSADGASNICDHITQVSPSDARNHPPPLNKRNLISRWICFDLKMTQNEDFAGTENLSPTKQMEPSAGF